MKPIGVRLRRQLLDRRHPGRTFDGIAAKVTYRGFLDVRAGLQEAVAAHRREVFTPVKLIVTSRKRPSRRSRRDAANRHP